LPEIKLENLLIKKERYGYRLLKSAGPKFAEVMKLVKQVLAWKHSTILMAHHVKSLALNNLKITSKKQCSGKCLLKQTRTDTQ
jgi:hypothetical protein